jgi:hypothetical protein
MTAEGVGPQAASIEHVRGWLRALEGHVATAVERRRSRDPRPDDPFRGLYVTDADVARLLDPERRGGAEPSGDDGAFSWLHSVEEAADAAEAAGATLRMRDLATAHDLEVLDTGLLVVALAVDIDPRFERLYGYLNDDVTRRRPTVGLAIELIGLAVDDAAARRRLSPSGSLVAKGIVVLEDRERPFLARSLRVPDRITAFLLGDDSPDAELVPSLNRDLPVDLRSAPVPLTRALGTGVRLAYLRAVPGSAADTSAVSAVSLAGLTALAVDLSRVAMASDPRDLIARAIAEARLRWAVLVAGPIDPLLERSPSAIGDLADAGWPTVLFGARAWEPAWARAVPLELKAPELGAGDRSRLWQAALGARADVPANGHVAALGGATQAFHLTPMEIDRAIQAGVLLARAEDRELDVADLQAGARRQNAAGLERLSRRIEPSADWTDLVVPADVERQLLELASRARYRDRVVGEWRLGGRSARGRGITALFAGESGTGKTLSAEVVAHELGLDLYVIDLSTVVDKYIGETEKNLDRIFSEADRVNGVLLFDEADAIFGKRSEVRDARDRYANVEVAYLLQRMERFDGLAVLTTNLRANLDESFTRRLDAIVDFPTPDEPARRALWRMHLPDELPQADDLDLEFLAGRFSLAGGSIRNICVTAAYLAARAETPVDMAHLIRATGREYQKLGRLTVEAEFGPYLGLLSR